MASKRTLSFSVGSCLLLLVVALCLAADKKVEKRDKEDDTDDGALVKSFQMVDEPVLINDERGGRSAVIRRALKPGPAADEVNALPDASSGQNYPLRPFTMTNLTDILAVEYTCNSSLGLTKGLSPEKGCNCVRQMVREGNKDSFDKCCQTLWKWIQKLKKDKEKIKIIMLFQPEQARQRSDKEGKKEPKLEFFEEYKDKATECLKGKDFGDLRTDKLSGLMVRPCQILIAMLIIIFASSHREYFTQ